MKIAVVGNCQHAPLAQCLQVLLPAAKIKMIALNQRGATDPAWDSSFADSEIIVTQLSPESPSLAERYPNKQILTYPRLAFAGYFPDFTMVYANGRPIGSPIGNFHSSIAAWAFANGLTASSACQLFREDVYRFLGYLDSWTKAEGALLREGQLSGFPLNDLLAKWTRRHPFMHAATHPKLFVMADIARQIADRLDPGSASLSPEDVLPDSLLHAAVWPVYPEIALHHGFCGSYSFKLPIDAAPGSPRFEIVDIDEYVRRAYEIYRQYAPASISSPAWRDEPFKSLESLVDGPRTISVRGNPHTRPRGVDSPYLNIPSYQFWPTAVSSLDPAYVDPVVGGAFKIARETRIATAGSCFAQHIANRIASSGYSYFVAEPAPPYMPAAQAKERQYGLFSARFGNIYTSRQLLQLFERAYGTFQPRDVAWLRSDGRLDDPFRPTVEPAGFESSDAVEMARMEHFSAVRRMFEELEIFVFTLGLTETWVSTADGAAFPLAPGVRSGRFSPNQYEFVNLTAADVTADLEKFLARLRTVNPTARVILTVSPVPLNATFENRHVIVSTTASKSSLLVAADAISRRHSNVCYFPSYEIITGSYNFGQYYEGDARNVNGAGVARVMELFERHFLVSVEAEAPREESDALAQIICDEEEIRLAQNG